MSLPYYCSSWNKLKKLKGKFKLNAFILSNGSIKLKLLENGPVKPITHAADFKNLFPNVSIFNM